MNAQDPSTTWVFNRSSLDMALERWTREQLDAYPHQKEKIELTVLAMRDFLDSQVVRELKMVMTCADE